jgi:hypothetical protein
VPYGEVCLLYGVDEHDIDVQLHAEIERQNFGGLSGWYLFPVLYSLVLHNN